MKLAIYGAGGLGREVCLIAQLLNSKESRWEEIVFVDDGVVEKRLKGLSYFTFDQLVNKNFTDIEICIAIGEPQTRVSLRERVVEAGLPLATLVHPNVYVPDSSSVSPGCIICNYVSITCDIHIAENVYIHPNVCVGHDARIGSDSVISSFVDVAGNCTVGCQSFIAMGVIMKHGTTVGANTIIGMSSVVNADIPDGVIALGNPARPMKRREDKKVFG